MARYLNQPEALSAKVTRLTEKQTKLKEEMGKLAVLREADAGFAGPANLSDRPQQPLDPRSYAEHFGKTAYIARCRSVYQRATGAVLSPLAAFLLLQGVETVALRVERHVENGRCAAEFLRSDPRVAWVNYAGFADSPYHALTQKYLGGCACSLFTFGIVGGLQAG